MKYEVQPTTKFKKDLKLCKSRGYDIELINQIIKKLANGEKLEEKKFKLKEKQRDKIKKDSEQP